MPKTSTRSTSATAQSVKVMSSRDAEILSAPIRVTDGAQAKDIDVTTARRVGSSQIEAFHLSERPSTSGGVASKQRNTEKRETKDDLHFYSLRAHGSRTTFYNFPIPGSRPTSSNLSRPIRTSSLPRARSPNLMNAISLNVPPMEIGMALGSPSHQPQGWDLQTPSMPSVRNETDSLNTYLDDESMATIPSKQKSSKWKIFGGLFGGSKRSVGSPNTFYQLQSEEAVRTMGEIESPKLSRSSLQRSKSRGRSEKRKPDMKRAQTAPLNFDFQDSSRERGVNQAPIITLEGGPLNLQTDKPHGSLLNVEIPSVEMERYSIMFGSLLQKPNALSSPLLQRRQATLDRLQTVDEETALREQELEEKAKQLRTRRATSPQLTNSPVFSLFPNTRSRSNLRGSPSPDRRALQRSNTSPAALSPSRPTFAPGSEDDAHATLMAPGPHVPVFLESEEIAEKTQEPTQKNAGTQLKSQSSRNWSSEESHLNLDSPCSEMVVEEEEDGNTSAVPFVLKSKLNDLIGTTIIPQHAPSPSVSGSTSSSSDRSTSTFASSVSTKSFTATQIKTVKIQAPPKVRSRSATTTSQIAQSSKGDPIFVSTLTSKAPITQSRHKEQEILTTPSKTPFSQLRRKASSPSLWTSPSTQTSVSLKATTSSNPSTSPDLDVTKSALQKAADVSIARQISVSRQQRHLLIPITSTQKSRHNANFPSPSTMMNVNRVASPLDAVKGEMNARPGMERKDSLGSDLGGMGVKEVKPVTPQLVVVGEEKGEWDWIPGNKEDGENGGLNPDVFVGGHQYRKSERVVVERVSVASSS